MCMSQGTTTDAPTTDEQLRFFVDQSVRVVGYRDTVTYGIGDSPHAVERGPVGDVSTFLRNLEVSFYEGMQSAMRNKREHGWSPIGAWNQIVDDEWPDWVKARLAESEWEVFGGLNSDPDLVDDEKDEYLSFLFKEYDVPR